MPNVLAKHFPQKVKHSAFHPLPHVEIPLASRRFFPPKSLVPRPRPLLFSASTAALASMSRSTAETWPLRAAACSGVSPREPRPEGPKARRQNPNGTEGEKKSEKILAPQKWKFWKLWTLKLLTKVKKHCCFEMSWGHWVVGKTWRLCYSSQRWLG